jgi:hypothetical protein
VESRYLSVTTVVSFSLVTDSLFLRFLVTRVKPDSFQKEDKADADRDDTRPYVHCRVLVLHQSIPVLLLQGRHRFDPEGWQSWSRPEMIQYKMTTEDVHCREFGSKIRLGVLDTVIPEKNEQTWDGHDLVKEMISPQQTWHFDETTAIYNILQARYLVKEMISPKQTWHWKCSGQIFLLWQELWHFDQLECAAGQTQRLWHVVTGQGWHSATRQVQPGQKRPRLNFSKTPREFSLPKRYKHQITLRKHKFCLVKFYLHYFDHFKVTVS